MAADLLSAAKNQFKFDEVDSDNWLFKLYYRASVSIFLAGSVLCVATTYIGTPIVCDFRSGISGDLVNQYCWLHGSYHIDESYQDHFGCYANQKTKENEDRTTVYYQWVVFVLVLNAALFILPRKVWKLLEGGIIKQFGKTAKSAFILCDPDSMKTTLANYVSYYNVLKYKTDRYFAQFVLCEFFNFLILIFNFCLTNIFLGHEFSTYGMDVLNYYTTETMIRKDLKMINPMCNIFPTRVSCDVQNIGPSGREQNHNGICILSQNIINEKIFLALWFWYIAMIVVSSVFFIYRLATIAVPSIRAAILVNKIGGSRRQVRFTVTRVLRHSSAGDWFLLNQIAKNTNPFFFREFIMAVYEEMKSEHYMEDKAGNGSIDLVSFDEKRAESARLNNANDQH